jgi:hypothetical protein
MGVVLQHERCCQKDGRWWETGGKGREHTPQPALGMMQARGGLVPGRSPKPSQRFLPREGVGPFLKPFSDGETIEW